MYIGNLAGRVDKSMVAALCAVVLVAGAVYLYARRNTFQVVVSPGQTEIFAIEMPLQRLFEHKSYAKGKNLPVECAIEPEGDGDDGVTVTVLDTGHRVHVMWVDLRVDVDPDAASGLRKRYITFTIDGVGGWPMAVVFIRVGLHESNGF